MEVSVEPTESLDFSRQVNFDLRNYIDKAMLQTMIDSKEENDEPLKITEIPLFKGTGFEKTIDRLVVNESVLVSLLYKTKPKL